MQAFIDTALETEMGEVLGYSKHKKSDKINKHNGHTKKTTCSDIARRYHERKQA